MYCKPAANTAISTASCSTSFAAILPDRPRGMPPTGQGVPSPKDSTFRDRISRK